VVSRSCKNQLEGYWQQSLHQLGKTEMFPKSGLLMTSFVSRPYLFLPSVLPCIRPLYNDPLSNTTNDRVLWVKILHITTIKYYYDLNYLCNQCLSPLTLLDRIPSRRDVLDTILCHKICQ
jgi:hypothetical protein